MAFSIFRDYQGPDWPLGFVKVATPGTPVNIMSVVDPSNNNSPNTSVVPGSTNKAEYTPIVYSVWFQGMKPGANNTGMVYNSGNVYVMRAAAGGNGNYTDPGAMVQVLEPGTTLALPICGPTSCGFSPYRYFLDADNANDGALCTAIGAG